MIESYGKVYNLGHRHLAALFDGPVVVQEKVDGSQVSWRLSDWYLEVRSRNQVLNLDDPPKLFEPTVRHLQLMYSRLRLRPGIVYRGEALCAKRHNKLTYGRVPAGHVVLFDAYIEGEGRFATQQELVSLAAELGVESVPFKAEGVTVTGDMSLGKLDSFLGGPAEGVVIKNYAHPDPVSGTYPLKGKLVADAFRETKPVRVSSDSKDVVTDVVASLTTDARFAKALQHLAEDGTLTNSKEDIGPLLRGVAADLESECRDVAAKELMRRLWPTIRKQVCTRGARWYQERLASK